MINTVTLLTDFGTEDSYVGEVKGILLGSPHLRVIDLTHQVPAFDTEAGAFQLLRAYRAFPKDTVHLAVVDPGVGTLRRALYIRAGHYHFVGPDNGLLRWAVEDAATQTKQIAQYFKIPTEENRIPTFHARDVFAPFIVQLALGKKINLKEISEIEGRALPENEIVSIDHYGNAITSVPLTQAIKGLKVVVSGLPIDPFPNYEAIPPFTLGLIQGSHGFWEISCRSGSAALMSRLKRGDRVEPILL